MSLRLGIDTGGTYTDAALLAGGDVVAKSKSLTTRYDLIEGIRSSLTAVLAERRPDDVSLVSLSTTLATNAIVEGHGARAALLLVGYQQSQLKLAHLNEATRDVPVVFISGGHDAGGQEKRPLDLQAAATELSKLTAVVDAIAVSSMFSVRNSEHEVAIRDLIGRTSGIPVTCGHELSAALDAPRRALTALINAKLIPLIEELISATRLTLEEFGIDAPLMVVRGDGSLVSADFAETCPVETILSGPAASVIGAQYLANYNDMIVSDIGGTTTDVALITGGEPRLSVDGASVNGWRTMVKAVQIETHALGGDSEIQFDRPRRRFSIGPNKVTPLCMLASRYPAIVDDLSSFVDEPWIKTNMAKFILLKRDPGDLKLTAQQRSMVQQVAEHPRSMQSIFAERHFSLALRRLIEMGVLTIAAFTPTDAAHVCSWDDRWDSRAATLGATLLSRYSKYNLGAEWSDECKFCESILAQVTQESALCIATSAINEMNGVFGQTLHAKQRSLLQQMFRGGSDMLSLRAGLSLPVVGIGAPALRFYPAMADYLDVEVDVPEHAEVANAVGAVVGVVKQLIQITITPISGRRVMVHAPEQQREFDTLEPAAEWASQIAGQLALKKAESAGGSQITVSIARSDNIVEHQGQTTFFESTIVATATGRVA